MLSIRLLPSQTAFRIGINPTAIAYNYLTSTLVSTNTASHTVTVADFLGPKNPRGPDVAAGAFGQFQSGAQPGFFGSAAIRLDIHPFTNVAVIADTANGRVLFVPLPR